MIITASYVQVFVGCKPHQLTSLIKVTVTKSREEAQVHINFS